MINPAFTVSSANAFVRAMSSHGVLTAEDAAYLQTLCTDLRSHRTGATMRDAPKGAELHQIVLSGWVAWTYQLPDGRRQILSLNVPGDVLENPAPHRAEVSARTLTVVTTASIDGLPGHLTCELVSPTLNAAWTGFREAAIRTRVDHMLRLGRLTAYERMASLLIEMHGRLMRAGVASASDMPFPLKQDTVADVLGLSVVHVNRIIQQLRREGLIRTYSHRVAILDRDGLLRATHCD